MKQYLFLFVVTATACGGAPFEPLASEQLYPDAAPSDDAKLDTQEQLDAQAQVDGQVDGHAPDASSDSALDSALLDSAPAPDAALDSSTQPDALVDSACVPPTNFTCSGTAVAAPSHFCWHQTNNGTSGVGVTPGACQACGSYTCACLLQAWPSFCNVQSCSDSGGHLTITCQ